MIPSPFFRQQSTFIPQQTSQNTRRGGYYDFFFIVGNIALIGMILVWVGFFGYRFYLNQEIKDLEKKLTDASNKALTEENLQRIEEFKALYSQINNGKDLINSHIALKPIFDLINDITLTSSVRFSSFKYEIAEGNTFKVTMQGSATSFSSLAYQEKVFKDSASIATSTIMFSGFSLDDKTGNVTFSLSFTVMPKFLLFKNTEEGKTPAVSTETSVDTLSASTTNNQTP